MGPNFQTTSALRRAVSGPGKRFLLRSTTVALAVAFKFCLAYGLLHSHQGGESSSPHRHDLCQTQHGAGSPAGERHSHDGDSACPTCAAISVLLAGFQAPPPVSVEAVEVESCLLSDAASAEWEHAPGERPPTRAPPTA